MLLKNKTTNKIIANNLKIASSWLEASLGLLNQPKGTAMLFHTRWGIHTFGMKYPIDVLILNNHLQVVKIRKNLSPNHLFFWNPFYSKIIEIPSFSSNLIQLGDILEIR